MVDPIVLLTEAASEGGHVAAQAGNIGKQVSDNIMGHVTNSYFMAKGTWAFHIGDVEIDLSITKHTLMMFIVAFLLILMAIWVKRKVNKARQRKSLVPRGGFVLVENLVLFIRDEIANPTMGHHAAASFTPFLCTTFFFILCCNLLGLVPFGATATGNLAVTATLAMVAFFSIQIAGMRKMGFFGYFKHLMPSGVPWWLAPVMIPVELMGMLAKPFALCVRLFANMTAGHVVILSLIGLIFVMGYAISPVTVMFGVFMYVLELLVAFLQAYIFTMLTSLFIGLLVASEH